MRYAVQSGIIRYNPALDMAGALTTVKRQHRPALDLSRLPELLSRINSYKGQPVTRLAVMLNLLVFIRSSELRYARWSEIDIDNAMWDYSSRTQTSARGKIHTGAQDANTTSCATQQTGCSHTDRTSDMGW